MKLPIEMYRTYVTRRSDDLHDLVAALSSNDVSVFRKVGHQLKGNASSFGFDELLTVSDRLHNITIETIAADGPGIIDDLKKWIDDKKKKFDITS